MTLHGGLEEKLNMGIKEDVDNHISMKNGNKPQSTSRRSFLQKLFGLGAGAVIGSSGMTISNDAKAYDMKSLPPGFWPEICKDDMISGLFGEMYFGLGNLTQWEIKDRLMRKIGLESKQVKENSPFTEPAYWFTVNYFNSKFQQRGSDGEIYLSSLKFYPQLKSRNPAMHNWALGIGNYFATWVDRSKKYASINNTETYLLLAIFTAAGKNESEVHEYMKYDLTMKERKLKEIMNSLEKRDFTNQLIAAWSSFFLANHYWTLDNNSEYLKQKNLINKTIEVPLRKYIPKIRGSPFYLNNKL